MQGDILFFLMELAANQCGWVQNEQKHNYCKTQQMQQFIQGQGQVSAVSKDFCNNIQCGTGYTCNYIVFDRWNEEH